MIHPIFNIDTKLCTTYFYEMMQAVDDLVDSDRPEFITPEHVLAAIMKQVPFQKACEEMNFDTDEMEDELNDYLYDLDKVPADEEYMPILSNQMIRLIANMKNRWERLNTNHVDTLLTPRSSEEEVMKSFNKTLSVTETSHLPFRVANTLFAMMMLKGTFAQYLIFKYLDEVYPQWNNKLLETYTAFMEKDESKEGRKADTKKREGDESRDALEKIMGALKSLGGNVESATIHIAQGRPQPDNQEERRKDEPWQQFATDIMSNFKKKNPLVGRQKELERAIRVLCRRDKNNPLFIGEPGVGKTALIYGLAQMVSCGNVPAKLQQATIIELSMASIVAGASYNGELERRMKMVLESAKKKENCIIYIDEIHNIMGTGNGTNNVSEIIKPYLEDGAIRFIGSTTYQDYKKTIANNKALARRFEQIDIKEPSVEETIRILEGLKRRYEEFHGITYTDEAIRYAVEKSALLINDRFFPDKAIDIMDEAGALLEQKPLLNKSGEPKAKRYQKVGVDEVKHVLTEVCKIDAKALASSGNEELKNLDKRIGKQIYGQDEAIRQVVHSVMMSKAGLGEPDKPLASLLFVGPTGVGKTEVCKVLAKELGVQLVRFDMSEYTEKHTVSKLIGSPAGYVGYDEGGLLTDAIRKTPNCVLLLDEVEKAHPDIYNILLQIMDYASLTDNKGNKADFKNVILIMTSNAGAQYASQASVGFGGGTSKGNAMLNTVKKTFKPEFLNRLSGTVVFNDMDNHMASLILDKKLQQLSARLAAKQVTLTLTQAARAFLLQKGFTPQYGAREMDRAIQQHLIPLLMNEILFGKLKKGGNTTVELVEDGLKLK